MIRNDHEERAAKGAALMDEHHPGWAEKIDTEKLDMSNSCRCIQGLVRGKFSMIWAKILTNSPGNADDVTAEYGFDVYEDEVEEFPPSPGYLLLKKAWLKEIARRKTVETPPTPSVE